MAAERARRRAVRPAAWSLLACLLLAACAPLPRSANLPTVWQPSPNFGERVPNFVILHYTGDDSAAFAARCIDPCLAEEDEDACNDCCDRLPGDDVHCVRGCRAACRDKL